MAERLKHDLRHELELHQPLPDSPKTALEARYLSAARGHQEPTITITNNDNAYHHSAAVDNEDRRIIGQRPQIGRLIENNLSQLGRRAGAAQPSRFMIEAAQQLETAAQDALRASPLAADNQAFSRQVSGWFSEDYLGSTIYSRFSTTPPFLTTEAPGFFARADEAMGRSGTLGFCFWETNHIIISSSVRNEDDRKHIMVHEQLHYASWLGGGQEIRWRNANGEPTMLGYISWFHEGMTELHAQQFSADHGLHPSVEGYPYETAASFYLQRIVVMEAGDEQRGTQILRQAYLSGDFTEVRRMVDRRLGAGTFDTMMGAVPKQDGSRIERGAEALVFLRDRLDSAGIDHRGWDNDPLMRGAR